MATAAAPPAGGLLRWTPSLPTGVINMLNPFAAQDPVKQATDPKSGGTTATTVEVREKRRPSLFAAVFPSAAPSEDRPPSPSRSVMFAEPTSRASSRAGSRRSSSVGSSVNKSTANNNDGGAGAVVDIRTGRAKSRRKSSVRPKTCFSLCHPPPASQKMQKLHRRPRSLLQLHRLTPGARPVPAFEVIPSANFSVRLHRAVTKMFKTRHGLCPNDLVVLKAEKYSAGDSAGEDQDARDVVALICKGRKEDSASAAKARICLANGDEWEAYPTLKGGYEFFTTDEHGLGLTVRWVPKKTENTNTNANPAKCAKFNFSTISPNSRLHPVIATLSKTVLEVNDTYKIPNASAVTPLSTPKQSGGILADRMAAEDEDGDGPSREHCETDDRLRDIITATAIWVAFREGWSPALKYDEEANGAVGDPRMYHQRTASRTSAASFARSPSLRESPGKSPTLSGTLPSPAATPPASPSMKPLDRRASVKSAASAVLHHRSLLGARGGKRNGALEDVDVASPKNATTTAVPTMTGRSRGDSNATVLVHTAASNRMRKNSLVQQQQQQHTVPGLLSEVEDSDDDDDEAPAHPTTTSNKPATGPSVWTTSNGTGQLAENGDEETSDSKDEDDDDDDDDDGGASASTGAKRESSGTTDTKLSGNPPSILPSVRGKVGRDGTVSSKAVFTSEKQQRKKAKKVGGGWRKLFCRST